MRNIRYKNISDDEVVCSSCGGQTDTGLDCTDCGKDMWDDVYPEYYIGNYVTNEDTAPYDINDVHMVYKFTNGEVRDYYADHRVVTRDGVYELLNQSQTSRFFGLFVNCKDVDIPHIVGEMQQSHDDHFILHNENGPALLSGRSVFFFLKGIQCTIEDLPCDDMTKLLLTLKYGNSDPNRRYHPIYETDVL